VGSGVGGLSGFFVGESLPDRFPESAFVLHQTVLQAYETGSAAVRIATELAGAPWLGMEVNRAGDGRLHARLLDLRPFLGGEAELEARLAEAEARSAAKSRFLASLAHELRTPLNAILGFADAMKEEVLGPLPARYRGYPDLIHESGELLLELISDVLDMSRMEAERFELHPEIFDVREAARAVIRLMRGQIDRAGVKFSTPSLRERIEVRADRRALKQIALNLLSNALKATPAGGRIALSISVRGQDLVLSVSDTGRGIPAADLARLGQPFEQSGDREQRYAGSGLGLSIVKALAGLHGGDMTIRSRWCEGTSVEVRLPVILTEATQPELELEGPDEVSFG
jgi:cell cycle sensor histidine kinase DivJ